MVALTDIVPQSKPVPVPGGTVEVTGISLEGIAGIFARFPEIAELTAGRDVKLDAATLIKAAPRAVAAVIAAGCGQAGDEAAEAAARGLPLETQADVIEAILGLTLPSGIRPFVSRLAAMVRGVGAGRGETTPTPAKSSPKPPKS